MKKISKKTTVVIMISFLTAATCLALVRYHQFSFVQAKKVVLKKAQIEAELDTAKLSLLSRVYKNLNLNRDEFLIEGSISANNGADTTERLNNLDYIFSKKGSMFYYKLGVTETINANGLNIFIDHGAKKIMLSKEKKVVPAASLPDFTELIKKVKEEGFKILDSKTGDTEQITLSNPYHLTCKEYTVAFNSTTLVPQRMYTRLTNFSDPENSKKDNVIDFRISKVESDSEIRKYTHQNIVKKEKNGWRLNPGFEGYELINTLN